jgi:hypothetical protein
VKYSDRCEAPFELAKMNPDGTLRNTATAWHASLGACMSGMPDPAWGVAVTPAKSPAC